eukprot:TRINITY_DN11771_c0_g1_i1.p1 TRINITY_DN11771_c0_g1~~TRINITY_DN11771_c0_g1_i1.p1  ORF type:complete len:393 (-),score=54.09 TRINITY_DN11771_c0_g1_i1:30-1208(-)
MIRRPPRSTLSSSSAASDVYKRQVIPVVTSPHGGQDRTYVRTLSFFADCLVCHNGHKFKWVRPFQLLSKVEIVPADGSVLLKWQKGSAGDFKLKSTHIIKVWTGDTSALITELTNRQRFVQGAGVTSSEITEMAPTSLFGDGPCPIKPVKVTFCGDPDVGTSSIVSALVGRMGEVDSEPAEYVKWKVRGPGESEFELRDANHSACEETDVLVLVFDLLRPESLENTMGRWLPKFKQASNAVILVGTKSDLYSQSDDGVSRSEITEAAELISAAAVVMTSVTTGQGFRQEASDPWPAPSSESDVNWASDLKFEICRLATRLYIGELYNIIHDGTRRNSQDEPGSQTEPNSGASVASLAEEPFRASEPRSKEEPRSSNPKPERTKGNNDCCVLQ